MGMDMEIDIDKKKKKRQSDTTPTSSKRNKSQDHHEQTASEEEEEDVEVVGTILLSESEEEEDADIKDTLLSSELEEISPNHNQQTETKMVFNSVLVASVATVSTDIWQSIACISEPISGQELLDLVICFPLHQLAQFALCIWSFFCLPLSPVDSYYHYYTYDDEDEDEDDDDDDLSSAGGCFSGYDPYSDDHSD
ncbi:hypothetical protein QVD17_00999 [Tagetes erecta]|uniref:Uncharacterized protein n=1 Tax=Tagetes erecta TaxID=13708 RepID=A0AAD8L671_TARER|nr:hypothetical protein QVD17_00999 [Tagetes erecta]